MSEDRPSLLNSKFLEPIKNSFDRFFTKPDAPLGHEDVKTDFISELKELVSVAAVALILMVVFRTLFFQPYTIPSASMEPNLYEGDYIIVSKWDYGYSKYSSVVPLPISGRIFDTQAKRGDIVVFKLPHDNKTDYIKRVIGLPGDRVQMIDNRLYLNGTMVPSTDLGLAISPKDLESYAPAKLIEEDFDGKVHKVQDFIEDGDVDNTIEYIVPEKHYFVMGDNRDNSQDSRYIKGPSGVGFVPYENLEGRATIVLMSWKTGSSLLKPWTWLNFRWNRFFKSLD